MGIHEKIRVITREQALGLYEQMTKLVRRG